MLLRQSPVGVIQICWIAPEPWISARVNVWPGAMSTDGETFQPRPRSRAAPAFVPSVAIPPLPFSPVKFSGLIERVWALDNRDRLPRFMPKPLNAVPPRSCASLEAINSTLTSKPTVPTTNQACRFIVSSFRSQRSQALAGNRLTLNATPTDGMAIPRMKTAS